MSQPSLFNLDPAATRIAPPDPLAGLSTRRRLTIRQLTDLQMRVHPVTKHPLLPAAPPATNRSAPGPRCGSCAHLYSNSFRFPKCDALGRGSTTRGQATDIRKWWPACILYQPADQT
jgi:hypothetical protein